MTIDAGQKGGKLDPSLLADDEVMDSSPSLLEIGKSGHAKGLQQHFTPLPVAEFIAKVMGTNRPTLDLTAGNGALLSGFDKAARFGIEIDGAQYRQGDYRGFKADVQQAFPLLRRAMMGNVEQVALNPPFSLEWDVPGFDEVGSSTRLTYLMALELMSSIGQGVLITGKQRFDHEILPLASGESRRGHFYAVYETPDLWEDVTLDCVVAFFVKDVQKPYGRSYEHWQPPTVRREVALHDLRVSAVGTIEEAQRARRESNMRVGSYNSLSAEWFAERMKAVGDEHRRRVEKKTVSKKAHDVYLEGGKVRVKLTGFAKLTLASDDNLIFIDSLRLLPANWFAMNRKQWRRLMELHDAEKLMVDPSMIVQVEQIIRETEKLLAPMYEVKLQQRLAWIDSEGLEHITCIKSDPERHFVEGEEYRVLTFPDTKRTEIERNRAVVNKKTGEAAMKNFRITRKFLRIVVMAGNHRQEFGEDKADIEYLVEHFNLPDPGTTETKFPAEIARMEQLLDEVNRDANGRYPYTDPDKGWVKGLPNKWRYKPFQRMDLARLLFKGGGLLAWEQGLGKTLAACAFIEALFTGQVTDVQKCALIVAPRDLIPNWCDEWELWFGKRPQVITDYDQAREIAAELKAGGEGVWITHYECLSQRARKQDLLPFDWYGERYDRVVEDDDERPDEEPLTEPRVIPIMGYQYKVTPEWTEYVTNEDGMQTGEVIEHEASSEKLPITLETRCPECGADAGLGFHPQDGKSAAFCNAEAQDASWRDMGGEDDKLHKKRCNYQGYERRIRPIGNVLSTAFRHGVVVLDELTWIKGDYSERSKVIRGIQAQHVLGLTGTPIKNYVRDAFWGLWKCLGSASARFPYGYDDSTMFENDFCVIEQELKPNGNVASRRVKPEVTNLAKLWRLLSGAIIRRRKEETGEKLVARTFYPVVVPLGVAQRAQSEHWLKNFATFFARENPDHPVVLSGAVHFMAPMLGQLAKLEYAATCPEADMDRDYWDVEVSNWTPKNAKTLEIAMHHAALGQKVLIGSCTLAATAWFGQELNHRHVKTETMLVEDEEGPPRSKEAMKRAAIVKKFQAGDAQVLSAGVAAMAYGHNLDKGSVIILNGLPWDYASLDQFIARCHRLTSKHEVSIYIMLAEGTLDEKKWNLLTEKGDAACLALDGRLIEQQEAPISKEEVLRELAERGLQVTGDEVSEVELEREWKSIHSREDLPEFTPPEPQEVITATAAETTDATTFDREKIRQRIIFEESELELDASWDEEETGGELRGGAEAEESARVEVGEAEVGSAVEAEREGAEAGGEEEGEEAPVEVKAHPALTINGAPIVVPEEPIEEVADVTKSPEISPEADSPEATSDEHGFFDFDDIL